MLCALIKYSYIINKLFHIGEQTVTRKSWIAVGQNSPGASKGFIARITALCVVRESICLQGCLWYNPYKHWIYISMTVL